MLRLLAFRRNLLPQSSILEATNSCDAPSTTHNSTQRRGVKSKLKDHDVTDLSLKGTVCEGVELIPQGSIGNLM
jgi:hypothetical protein